MQALYTAEVSAKAGRNGHLHSSDGTLDLPVTMPKALGGPGGPGTNPEQLFAAGYAACFGSAAMLVAGQKKMKPGEVTITAKVSIGKAGEGFALAVELVGHFPDLQKHDAEALMEAAHKVCPYSNATRNNVPVKLSVG